ncbi:MAG TPA: hypothetical protein VFS42_06505 [Burkholderiaceae bacterium]|nr:hypothetical protein [Burkholderiaceae bacterium]
MQKISIATLLAAVACAAGAVHAQEVVYGTPRATSYLGAPLALEVPVEASQGGRLAIPCIEINRSPTVSGTAVKTVVTGGKVALSRNSESSGVMLVRSKEIIRESPALVSIETGCTNPKRMDLVVDVAAPPVVPMSTASASTAATAPAAKKASRKGSARAATTNAPASSGAADSASVTREAMQLGAGFDPQIVFDRVREMPRLPSSPANGTAPNN